MARLPIPDGYFTNLLEGYIDSTNVDPALTLSDIVYVNSVILQDVRQSTLITNAEKWSSPITVTFTGGVTGNVSFDGSTNVTADLAAVGGGEVNFNVGKGLYLTNENPTVPTLNVQTATQAAGGIIVNSGNSIVAPDLVNAVTDGQIGIVGPWYTPANTTPQQFLAANPRGKKTYLACQRASGWPDARGDGAASYNAVVELIAYNGGNAVFWVSNWGGSGFVWYGWLTGGVVTWYRVDGSGSSGGDFVKKTGDTMTGYLLFDMGRGAKRVLDIRPGSDAYGDAVLITANGLTIVGGGESPTNYFNTVAPNPATENLVLCADGHMYFFVNGNTIGNRIGMWLNNAGNLYPETAGTMNIGTNGNRFLGGYFLNLNFTGTCTGGRFVGDGSGLTNLTQLTGTQQRQQWLASTTWTVPRTGRYLITTIGGGGGGGRGGASQNAAGAGGGQGGTSSVVNGSTTLIQAWGGGGGGGGGWGSGGGGGGGGGGTGWVNTGIFALTAGTVLTLTVGAGGTGATTTTGTNAGGNGGGGNNGGRGGPLGGNQNAIGGGGASGGGTGSTGSVYQNQTNTSGGNGGSGGPGGLWSYGAGGGGGGATGQGRNGNGGASMASVGGQPNGGNGSSGIIFAEWMQS